MKQIIIIKDARKRVLECCEDALGHNRHDAPHAQCITDDLRKSKRLHSVSANGHGPVYIGPCIAGVAKSRHAFGGTVSTWAT